MMKTHGGWSSVYNFIDIVVSLLEAVNADKVTESLHESLKSLNKIK